MAVLGTKNITTTLVRNTLGEDNNDVGLLCKSSKINMFSKRKPVRDSRDFLAFADVGVADNYGIVVPDWNGGNQVWTYNHPRGGSREPYRIGDFRQYYHEAGIPFRMTDYDGYIHYAEHSKQLTITGIATPGGNATGIAISDVLTGYYFAVQLKNLNNDVVWGTASSPDTSGIVIDFTAVPFLNNDNWLNTTIEIKAFLSSVQKSFADSEPSAVSKKALHYDATYNIVTQTLSVNTRAFIEAEITGIRPLQGSGTWLNHDNFIDPSNPPLPMVSTGGIALRVRFKNNASSNFTLSSSLFTFGTPSNYHNVSRYTTFQGNMYNINGNSISGISIDGGAWSDEIILYDPTMLNWDGKEATIPVPAVEKLVTFYVYQYVTLLSENQKVNNTWEKQCAST